MKFIKIAQSIDELAKSQGYFGPVYHGSQNKFNEFDPNYAPNIDHTPTSDFGFIYLTADPSYASQYGASKAFYVDLGRHDVEFMKKGLERLKRGELDSLLVASMKWNPFKEEKPSLSDIEEIVILDPSRIKSADSVTYDDLGNEIPLSERLNKNKKDIRY